MKRNKRSLRNIVCCSSSHNSCKLKLWFYQKKAANRLFVNTIATYKVQGCELELGHFCRTRTWTRKTKFLTLELANISWTRTRLKIDQVRSPDYHHSTPFRIKHKKSSTLKTKSKHKPASNPGPTSSNPAYWPLHHVAVVTFEYNFSTYSHLDRARSFSVEPFRKCNGRLVTNERKLNKTVGNTCVDQGYSITSSKGPFTKIPSLPRFVHSEEKLQHNIENRVWHCRTSTR